jgi:hypothetical protein
MHGGAARDVCASAWCPRRRFVRAARVRAPARVYMLRWAARASSPRLLDDDEDSPTGEDDEEAAAPPFERTATDKGLQCPVCVDILCRPVGLACGHALCRSCLCDVIEHEGSVRCPVCREAAPAFVPCVQRALLSIIEADYPERVREREREVDVAAEEARAADINARYRSYDRGHDGTHRTANGSHAPHAELAERAPSFCADEPTGLQYEFSPRSPLVRPPRRLPRVVGRGGAPSERTWPHGSARVSLRDQLHRLRARTVGLGMCLVAVVTVVGVWAWHAA